jgi:hypothetical protein
LLARTNGLDCHVSIFGFGRYFVSLAGGEDFRAQVAAGLGPFIVLLGQHRAGKADDGIAAGEDADHVGPPAHLFIQALLGIIAPDLAPDLAGEGGERQDVLACLVQVGGGLREFSPPGR